MLGTGLAKTERVVHVFKELSLRRETGTYTNRAESQCWSDD